MPVSVMQQPDGHLSVFPHIMLDRAKPGLSPSTAPAGVSSTRPIPTIFAEAMLRSHRRLSQRPVLPDLRPQFYCRLRTWADPSRHARPRSLSEGRLSVRATTRGATGRRIGVDGAELAETIERYNRFAETGIDEDFGRGASELNRFNGDPLNQPNPACARSVPGPSFAVAVWPSDLASSAGLRTDARDACYARRPAESGLYAAGNDAASIFRGTYPGPGTMIGPAIVFAGARPWMRRGGWMSIW